MTRFEHRQTGTVILGALGGGGLFCLASVAWIREMPWIPLVIAFPLLAIGYLFSSLRILVTDDDLIWAFGPGVLRKRVPLREIEQAEVTKTHLWEGWGMHYTPRGWLYNVSGFDAVAIRLKSGKQFVLGTDQPRELAEAIKNSREEIGTGSPRF
ncbi:MAG: hypothetical protein U1D30_09810 [Planctomycetota bacterium]